MSQDNFDGSADLFEGFEEPMEVTEVQESSNSCLSSSVSSEAHVTNASSWKGDPLENLHADLHLLPVQPGPNHTLCVEYGNYRPGTVPKPHPKETKSVWDSQHVRMPFSPESVFPEHLSNGKRVNKNRWDVITQAVTEPIAKSQDLELTMKRYNISLGCFDGLHEYFDDYVSEDEMALYFKRVIPEMISILKLTPTIVTARIPLLKRFQNRSVTLSQQQVCALLVNAFFCTFPRRNSRKRNHEYENYPDINFNRLYLPFVKDYCPEKLKCLFNYFRRTLSGDVPKNLITYTRKCVRKEALPKWESIEHNFSLFHITSSGTIEEATGMLQADFANSYVGGGVLGLGCVQEEIRFLTCPELILSRLFTERLDDNEVLFVTGFECFSKHSGYGQTFKFEGQFNDQTEVEMTLSGPRRKTYLVAMDAINFHNFEDQYLARWIDRELNKAYVAFTEDLEHIRDGSMPVCVATGNWGCGAFGGDPELKSLIQMMAASVNHRGLVYYTFGDEKLRDSIHDMLRFLTDRNVSVGEVYRLIIRYREFRSHSRLGLFDFIYQQIESFNVDTDSDDHSEVDRRVPAGECEMASQTFVTGRSLCSDNAQSVKAMTKSGQDHFRSNDVVRTKTTLLKFDQAITNQNASVSDLLKTDENFPPLPSGSQNQQGIKLTTGSVKPHPAITQSDNLQGRGRTLASVDRSELGPDDAQSTEKRLNVAMKDTMITNFFQPKQEDHRT